VSRPAVAALEDARKRATVLLWPPVVGRWLRLAALAAFVGGGGGAASAGSNLQVPVTGGGGGVVPELLGGFNLPTLPPVGQVVELLAVAIAILLVLAIVYAVVGAVAEFALVGAVRDGDVGLFASARRYAGRGVRLFVFRAAVVVFALVFGGGPVTLVGWLALQSNPALGLLVVPGLVFAAAVALCAWLVLTLTTDLVVPAILAAEVGGPIAGWRRVAPVVTANPVDAGLYLLVRLVLGVAAGVVVGLVGSLVAIVASVPFAVAAAAALAAAGDTLTLVDVAALALIAGVFLLVTLVLVQIVRAPVIVYLRAYAVAILGRLSSDLALLASTDGAESVAVE
jgi:hypothetical protein